MNARSRSRLHAIALAGIAAWLLSTGCARTSKESVLSSETLKVVAVTESNLDINISEYRHYTTYLLYLDGEKLSDTAFASLLQDPNAANDTFVHSDVVVLGDDEILLASHNRDATRCWTTRLLAGKGNAKVETIKKSTTDCAPSDTAPGWQTLHDEAGNVLLVSERPFHVYPIAGYWWVLWIEGDVAALYNDDRDQEQLIVRLVRISTDELLAEQRLPMQTYAEPNLLHASPDVRRKWLLDNFAVSMKAPVSLQLRADNQLAVLPPGRWAEYQETARQNSEADARARAAGEAKRDALYRETHEAEAAQPPPVR